VEHHRNQHGLIRDFNAEIPLYQQTPALLQFLDEKIELQKGDELKSLREVFLSLFEHGILGETDVGFVEAWIEDYRNARATAKSLSK
jgi:hypothetical protein